MKKMEFQRALAERLMKAIMEEVYKDEAYPNVSFTTKSRTIRITLKIGMEQVNIYLTVTGQVEYSLRDVVDDSGRQSYYSYNPDDDHETVIEKAVADLTSLAGAFLKVRELHDNTSMELSYEKDNKPVIERYLTWYSCDEEEDEDE